MHQILSSVLLRARGKDVWEGSVPGRPQRAADYNLMRTAHLPLSVLEDGGWQKKHCTNITSCVTDGICAPAPNSYIKSPNHRPLPLQCGCIWRSARIGVFVRRQQRARILSLSVTAPRERSCEDSVRKQLSTNWEEN